MRKWFWRTCVIVLGASILGAGCDSTEEAEAEKPTRSVPSAEKSPEGEARESGAAASPSEEKGTTEERKAESSTEATAEGTAGGGYSREDYERLARPVPDYILK